MIISHDLKIIFIHVHRTAGSSLSNILRQSSCDYSDILSQHSNAQSLESDFFEKYADYFAFGIARNPWDRIASWYSLIHMNDRICIEDERKRFEEFIELDYAADINDELFHYNCLDYFTNKKGKLIVDKIFHYENLQNEIETLFNQLHLSLTEIPVLNGSNRTNHKAYFTNKSRSLIAEKCKKDIEYFNYKF